MPIYQMTFALEGHSYGWSESYWIDSPADNPVTFAQSSVVTNARDLRQALLARGYQLTAVRTQLVRTNEGVKVLRQGDLDFVDRPGNAAWEPAPPKVAVLARHRTPAGFTRQVFMRGWRTEIDGNANRVTFDAETLSAWNNWIAYAIAQAFGWFHQTVGVQKVITGYTVLAATGIVTLELDEPLTPVAGVYRVSISMPEKHPLDGDWTVKPEGENPLKYFITRPVGVRPFDGVPGVITRYNNSFVALVAGNPGSAVKAQRISTRTPGRPIYASRGRSATKILF